MNHRLRILLADDNREVAESIRLLISDDFELAGVVQDGMALVEAVLAMKPDVIVADISMPRMDGLAAMMEFRKRNLHPKVIFLTNYSDLSLAHAVLEAGAYGYVLKYTASTDLNPAIRQALLGQTFISPRLLRTQLSLSRPGEGGPKAG